MSLQRFSMEMFTLSREIIKLKRRRRKIEKRINNLWKLSDSTTDSKLIIRYSEERIALWKEDNSLRKEEWLKTKQHMDMESTYMAKLVEFKKMTLGNKVIVQQTQEKSLIQQEIEATYKLFGGKEDINDILTEK